MLIETWGNRSKSLFPMKGLLVPPASNRSLPFAPASFHALVWYSYQNRGALLPKVFKNIQIRFDGSGCMCFHAETVLRYQKEGGKKMTTWNCKKTVIYKVIQAVTFLSPRWRAPTTFDFGSRKLVIPQKGHVFAELPVAVVLWPPCWSVDFCLPPLLGMMFQISN